MLQQDITARVAKKLTVGDMKVALAWLDTDVGARITRAEEAASGSMDATRLAELLTAYNEAASGRAPEAHLRSDRGHRRGARRGPVAETMALGIALGMDSLQPQERRVGQQGCGPILAMPADKLQAVFAQQLPISYAYTYREISDADLAAYVGFPGRNRQALPGGNERRLHGRACAGEHAARLAARPR